MYASHQHGGGRVVTIGALRGGNGQLAVAMKMLR